MWKVTIFEGETEKELYFINIDNALKRQHIEILKEFNSWLGTEDDVLNVCLEEISDKTMLILIKNFILFSNKNYAFDVTIDEINFSDEDGYEEYHDWVKSLN